MFRMHGLVYLSFLFVSFIFDYSKLYCIVYCLGEKVNMNEEMTASRIDKMGGLYLEPRCDWLIVACLLNYVINLVPRRRAHTEFT